MSVSFVAKNGGRNASHPAHVFSVLYSGIAVFSRQRMTMTVHPRKDVLTALEVLRAFVEHELNPTIRPRAMTHDFGDGKGPVPAHRHANPDGTIGGWVANTAWVDGTVFIGPKATVYGFASVRNHARLYDRARVFDLAKVSGNAKVGGFARVGGSAQIDDYAHVYGLANVGGRAYLRENYHINSGCLVEGVYE